MKVNKPRLLINALALLAVALAHLLPGGTPAMVASGACILAALAVLYRNLPAMSNTSADGPRARTVRFVTLFNAAFIAAAVAFAAAAESGAITLTPQQGSLLLAAAVAVPMLVLGNVAPRLPFNRYTGLRLPWTVRDEDTWIVAHRILGYVSLPLGILTFALVPATPRVGECITAIVLIWIGIPGALSYVYFHRKWYGRL